MQNKQIATRVKLLCQEKGVAIQVVLAKCDVTKSFIYDLEARDRSPSCDKVARIADFFGCSVDYLLGRTDNPEVNR